MGKPEGMEAAIYLAGLIRDPGKSRLVEMHDAIRTALLEGELPPNFKAVFLAELFERVLVDEADIPLIAERLEQASAAMEAEGDRFQEAAQVLLSAIGWHRKADSDQISRLRAKIADLYVAEAEHRLSYDDRGHGVAADFYARAVDSIREIPSTDRQEFDVESKIVGFRSKMKEYRQQSLEEMQRFSTPVDLTDAVMASRAHVLGRTTQGALRALASISNVADLDQLRDQIMKTLEEPGLIELLKSSHMTRDARVEKNTPGFDVRNPDSAESKAAIHRMMIERHLHLVSLIVSGRLLPALNAFSYEHKIALGDLVHICKRCSFIPEDRVNLWAKGLYYGFNWHFDISTHLLVPQLEHLVRVALQHHGIETRRQNKQGVETENNLGTLLENERITEVFREPLVFEFKALLTDQAGGGLRHDLAHGLLGDWTAGAAYSVHLWWLCLSMVVNSIPWKPEQDEESPPEESSQNSSGDKAQDTNGGGIS